MKKVILKFQLSFDEQKNYILIPEGGEIICVHNQQDGVFIWVLCTIGNKEEERNFSIYPTGQPFKIINGQKRYIGTVFFFDATEVYHVFENLYK